MHYLPVDRDTKAPIGSLVPRGHLDATDDPEVIAAWQAAGHTLAIALEQSGLVALDVEGIDKTPDGIKSLEEIAADLPETLTQTTPSGGVHAIYRRTDESQARRIVRWRPGVDLLGRGYVVLYGLDDAPIVDLPSILASAFSERRQTTAKPATPSTPAKDYGPADRKLLDHVWQRVLDHGPSVKGQGGDQHAYALGCILLHGFALQWDEALALALRWNEHFPENQWDPDRLAVKLQNGASYAQGPYGEDRENHLLRRWIIDTYTPAPIWDDVMGGLKAAARYKGTRPQLISDASLIERALKSEPIPDEALERTVEAMRRHTPPGTTDEQLATALANSIPLDSLEVVAAVPSLPEHESDFEIDPKSGKPINNQHNIVVALGKLGATVKHDLFAERDLLWLPGKHAVRLEDTIERNLYLEVERQFGFRPAKEYFLDVVADLAYQHSFHPVRDYLDSLTWDQVERISEWLIAYAKAEDSEYVRAVSRLVLVAAVRRIRKPGCKFDEMLILESPQGKDKSSALKVLAVKEEWFNDDLPLNGDTKRQMESLAGHWIVEAGELKGMRKGEIADLKSFASRTVDKARLAYGRRTTERPRECIIIGTTNDATYLKDPTGNRRFWPVRVREFDIDLLRRDRDQLWAEAAHAEAQGESIRLDPSLYDVAAKEQDERRVSDPFYEPLSELLDGVTGRVPTLMISRVLGFDSAARVVADANDRRDSVMKLLGWEKSRVRFEGKHEHCFLKGSEMERKHRLKVEPASGALPWRIVRE